MAVKSQTNKPNLKNQINSDKKYPAISLIKKNPELSATISKLVKDRLNIRTDPGSPSSFYNLKQNELTKLSEQIKEKVKDTDNALALFPDLELAIQILVTSIISPKDMVTNELIYKTNKASINTELSSKLLTIIEEECEASYKIKNNLYDILKDILFEKGAYPIAVIPESSVDDIINSNQDISIESISEVINSKKEVVSLGILGNPFDRKDNKNGLSLEAFNFKKINQTEEKITHIDKDRVLTADKMNLFVTDNYKMLKLPMVKEYVNNARINKIIATESNMNSQDFERILYKNPNKGSKPYLAIKTENQTKRKSVGRPLILKLPIEAVIPVFTPSNEKDHIGYFILIDDEGNPINKNSNKVYLDEAQNYLINTSGTLSSFLLEKARKNLNNNSLQSLNMSQASKIYADIVEADLIERLKNGVYGKSANIARDDSVYNIMLARSLANQYTRLVYIPAELMDYFAFKYFDNGVGKSLLDDLKILTSLRGVLLFAKVMALTKNLIAITNVNMTLDPQDPDPQKTIELAVHEIMKMRQQYFPLGLNSPIDLVDWVQRAGFEFTFEGHPGLPQTKFDFESKNFQHQIPDNDLDELLRQQTFMAIGLNPEVIDNGASPEFATTVVANNLLLAKRVMSIQDKFTPQITSHVRKILKFDVNIKTRCLDFLKENKGLIEKSLTDEEKAEFEIDENKGLISFYNDFIENFELGLPKPDITSVKTQLEAFSEYSDALDKAIDSWINSEFLTTDMVGEVSNMIETIKNTFKSYFLRKWMAENGFMTELSDITAINEEGDPSIDLYEIMKTHNEGLVRSSVKFMDSLKSMKNAANKDIENMGTELTESSSSDYSSDSESGDGSGGENEDDMFGDMDMGDETDTGSEKESSDETDTGSKENTSPKTINDVLDKDL